MPLYGVDNGTIWYVGPRASRGAPDPLPESVFVITAYELTGKPLAAYKRRIRRKP